MRLIFTMLFGLLGLLSLSNAMALEQRQVTVPPFKKVVLVLFENEDFDKPLALPFFSKMAADGALLTDYHAVAHPSEPNYIALTSGDTYGIKDDEIYDLDAKNLGDLLEAKGRTWRNYAEDFPGGCYAGARKGGYARKHTPFMSYKDISGSERCKYIVDASRFPSDVRNGTLPDFSFYTPNMDNDGHDTDVGFAEKWLNTVFSPLIKTPAFKDVLLILTFDEDNCYVRNALSCHDKSNRVYTVFYGRDIKPGAKISTTYDHYSLLRTIEEGFGLGTLGKKDDQASPIAGVWARDR